MEKNKIVKFLFALFIAVIFIVSYSTVFSSTAVSTSTTTAKQSGPTTFASGTSNATVTGYAPQMNISVKCSNSLETAAVFLQVSNSITDLEANNSVSIFYPLHYNITVQAGNSNTLQIYSYEYSRMNASAVQCTAFATGQVVELPQKITLVVQNQKLPITLQNDSRSYILPTTLTQNMSSLVHVKIAALVTQTGALYGNLSVTRAQV